MIQENDFIQNLVNDNTGWKPLPLTRGVLLGWLIGGFALVSILMAFSFSGFRDGFFAELQQSPQFLIEIVGASIVCSILAALGLMLSVPGSLATYQYPRMKVFIPLSLGFLGAYLVYACIHPALTPSMEGKRSYCLYEALVYGLLLSGVYFRMLLKRVALYPTGAAIAGGIASALIPAILMQLGCMYDPYHALAFHYGPALALGAIGYGVARFVLSKR